MTNNSHWLSELLAYLLSRFIICVYPVHLRFNFSSMEEPCLLVGGGSGKPKKAWTRHERVKRIPALAQHVCSGNRDGTPFAAEGDISQGDP